MATNPSAKSTAKPKAASRTRSATGKPAAKRTVSKRPAAQRRVANARRGYQLPKMQDVPTWATALASVVSVGVAVGVGLFATRKQWLPQAEEWGEQLQEKFQDRFGRAQNDDDRFADDDDWEGAPNSDVPRSGAKTANTAAA